MQSHTVHRQMIITIGTLELTAELADTPTAEALWNALPLSAQANRWGDEIYFSVAFRSPLETGARPVVDAGDVAYWPDGPALCFFFGPTPVSRPGEIRAAGPVNICGRIAGDSTLLRQAADGAGVLVQRAHS
jgi:uncharacterized protein